MADVTLEVQRANAAIDDMVKANTDMVNALQELLSQLGPLKASFSGQTAAVYEDFQNQANTAIQTMNAQFGTGQQALKEMVDGQVAGDKRGSGMF
ncbi:WXG100 family type VII secretion target [Streptomyces sp. NBC_01020]|uniref:WXG100 family type VII secretion target n=1 Tax=unclassified Streptomyces TaxID=2593676 RepID=UPI00224DD830|nr:MULTISPECIES: WXG100 family type VII secretion target [unclassified Streptomyces]MCX4724132.1 WXG100 family type VII secretion target [Streptomyces sp. NBC_01306]WSV06325.1 WXG100 family type VII secretion target [Streptomyces sp. NBC_01020]WSX67544.1 WXG100 family type VII secretion target [Streptomyces sp. NBC_00932]